MDLKDSGKLPVSLYDSYLVACCQLGHQTPAQTDTDKATMDWQDQSQQPHDYRHLLGQIVHCTDSTARLQLFDNVSRLLTRLIAQSSKSAQPVAAVPLFAIDLQSVDANQPQHQICCKVMLSPYL